MIRLVHGRVPAGVIGDEAVLPKALRGIGVRRLEDDVDAPPQVAEHGTAVPFQRGHNLHLPLVMQQTAGIGRPQHMRQIVGAARRKLQAMRRRRQAGGVGDGSHFDARLGTVEEGIEHL